jgi:hypothetical protein
LSGLAARLFYSMSAPKRIGPNKRRLDLVGQRCGRLTVVSRVSSARWRCVCDCGTTLSVRQNNLRKRTTRSCGCLALELLARHRRAGREARA